MSRLFFIALCCAGLASGQTLKACFMLKPNSTMSIQQALDLCGPGMAVVLEGPNTFHSGPLLIPRAVTLAVAPGATLQAQNCGKEPFIFSYQAPYSGVAGGGTIDGQEQCPVLITDYESQGFHVADIHLKGAAEYALASYKTTDLSVANLQVTAEHAKAGVLLSNVDHAEISGVMVRGVQQAVAIEQNILGPTTKVTLDNIAGQIKAPSVSTLGATAVLLRGDKRSLTVAADDSGDFTTVQAAIDALPADGGEILIKPGTYREVVTLRKPHVHLHGDPSGDPSKTVVIFNNAGPTHGGTFNSSTFFVEADDETLDHFTVANDAGPHAGQAVALSVRSDRVVFRHMRFLGAQDTLYAMSKHCYSDYGPCVPARQYFADSYIEGGVDFIFGDAKAVFERCELHGIATGNVMYTAQSKHTPDQDSGYVFKDCKLTGAPRSPGNIALGRAWRPYATVVFLNAQIDAPVIPAGWVDWPRFGVSTLPTAFFAEYHSTGPGADPGKREPFSHQLTADEAAKWASPAFLAGSDGWNPETER